MPEGDREPDAGLGSIGDVEVGVADPAAGDPDPDLGSRGLRPGDVDRLERFTGANDANGAHRAAGYEPVDASWEAAGIGSERARTT